MTADAIGPDGVPAFYADAMREQVAEDLALLSSELPAPIAAELTRGRTSVQKVADLLDGYQRSDLDGLGAMQALALEMAMPMIRGHIPTDPVELDGLIDQAIAYLHGLQSDPGSIE